MSDVNISIISGRLTSNPESFATATGKNYCVFNIACNEENGDKKEVNFFEITVWGATAESCFRYLRKGSAVMLEGKTKQEQWEKDGKKYSKLKVQPRLVHFLDRKPAEQQEPQPPQFQQPPAYQQRQPLAQPVRAAITEAIKQQEAQQQPDTIDDDIPF